MSFFLKLLVTIVGEVDPVISIFSTIGLNKLSSLLSLGFLSWLSFNFLKSNRLNLLLNLVFLDAFLLLDYFLLIGTKNSGLFIFSYNLFNLLKFS